MRNSDSNGGEIPSYVRFSLYYVVHYLYIGFVRLPWWHNGQI